jgi:hypothetical protein
MPSTASPWFAGTNTTPLPSAITRSPGVTCTPATSTGSSAPAWAIRPRAVRVTAPRAKAGKPSNRTSSTSRAAPSITTPAAPRAVAAAVRIPPQQDTSSRPPPAITTTSPGPAVATVAAATCPPGGGPVSTVRARPASRAPGHSGPSPSTDPVMPSQSSASETRHASSADSRASSGSVCLPAGRPCPSCPVTREPWPGAGRHAAGCRARPLSVALATGTPGCPAWRARRRRGGRWRG